jgi:hypothetical protein
LTIELDGRLDEEEGNFFRVRKDYLDPRKPSEERIGRLVVNRNRRTHMDVDAAWFEFEDGSRWVWGWEATPIERLERL